MIGHDRLVELCRVLVAANTMVEQASDALLGEGRHDAFRAALAGERPEGLTTAERQLIAMIPRPERETMLGATRVLEELTIGFEPMLHYHSRLAATLNDGFEPLELMGQAWIAFRRAVFTYKRLDVKFFTYARRVVKRELNRYVLQNPRNVIGSRNGEYEVIARAIWSVEPRLMHELQRQPTYHDYLPILAVKLPDIKNLRKKLMAMATGVGFGLDLLPERGQREVGNDYTALARQGQRPSDVALFEDEVRTIMDKAGVTGLHRELLRRRMNDESLEDISSDMNMTVEQVKSRLKVARRKLRRVFAAAA